MTGLTSDFVTTPDASQPAQFRAAIEATGMTTLAAPRRHLKVLQPVRIEQGRAALEEAVQRRADLEQAHAAEQQRLTKLARAAADRREGLAKLEGQVGARRSRIEAGEAELGRMSANAKEVADRITAIERDHRALESTVAQDEEGEEGLDEEVKPSIREMKKRGWTMAVKRAYYDSRNME